MIGADDVAQVFRIETGRQAGRTDQVAEHHGELTALGGRRFCRHIELLRLRLAQFTDRAKQLAAIAQDDAEFLQILIGKVSENGKINSILGEARGVLRHAQPSEPFCNILHCTPQVSNRIGFETAP